MSLATKNTKNTKVFNAEAQRRRGDFNRAEHVDHVEDFGDGVPPHTPNAGKSRVIGEGVKPQRTQRAQRFLTQRRRVRRVDF